jgi:ATP-binding cassette, subfamily B, multidrug efflux pump
LDGVLEGRAERVREAARVARLHDTVLSFPDGYDTRVGERGVTLSGGQRQRATLARAVARDPKVLVLDDALSAVDTHTETEILNELRSVLRKRTAIIVSHRMTAVMDADQILVLDGGQIVERGTHASLLARGGLYSDLLRRQMLEEDLQAADPLARVPAQR